jgi:hypothetical protein
MKNPNTLEFFDEKSGCTKNAQCNICETPIYIPDVLGMTLYEGKKFYHNRTSVVVGVIGKIKSGLEYEVLCLECFGEVGVN